MDARYQTELARMLTRETTAAVYLRVLAEVAEAQHVWGIHTDAKVADAIRRIMPGYILGRWDIEEIRVHHETAGFVRAVRVLVGSEHAPLVYLGMTSSDLIDTAAAVQFHAFRDELLMPDLTRLAGDLIAWAQRDEQRMGRTHGRLAEPVRIGAAYSRATRDLRRTMETLAVDYIPGKMSGPVGEGNTALGDAVALRVSTSLGIRLDSNSSQIVDRHFYRRMAANLIEVIAICEQLATLHRLSAIEGVDLFAEDFETGVQMGSSVMPHKRNPIKSERICGLARIARGHYAALLETWSTSWWERDLTNSSVERIAWWDLVQLSHFLVRETLAVIQGGHWRPDVPAGYQSPTAELIQRSRAGEDPDHIYREIQSRTIPKPLEDALERQRQAEDLGGKAALSASYTGRPATPEPCVECETNGRNCVAHQGG